MAQKTIANSESGSSVRTKLNSVLSRGIAFEDWNASGDSLPADADEVGSGEDGAILKGDRVYFTAAGDFDTGTGLETFPIGTIATAKQNSPTLTSHWLLKP